MRQQGGLYPPHCLAGRAVDEGMGCGNKVVCTPLIAWLVELLTRGRNAATTWAVAHFPALTQLPLQRWTGWSGHAEHLDPLAQTCHLLGFRKGCKHEVGFYGC